MTRSLGRAGHEVHVAAPGARSLAGMSRYARGSVRQTEPTAGPMAMGRSLVRAARTTAAELVWGVTDATLCALHAVAAELEPAALPPPDAATYRRASDKVELYRSCQALGIRVPDGIVVDGADAPTPQEVAPFGSPLVVRPALSWRAESGVWIRGIVSYERDAQAVAERMRRDPALGFPYLVQRRVPGDGQGIFVLARDGSIERVFAHRRLREKPPTGGVSTLCVSVPAPDDLLDAARRWADALRFTGIAMLEFKRDARSSESNLLEVNARPWGSMALAAAAGVDFPAMLLESRDSSGDIGAGAYRSSVRLRWWWGDVDHFYLSERERGRGGRAAMARGVLRALVAGPWPEAWDTFRRDDPVPFALETIRWATA